MVIKTKAVYLHCQTTTTGRLPRTIKRKSKWQQQFTTVYYTQQKKLIAISALKSTLLLGIWQIKNPKLKTADDLSDDLCLYCPLDDDEKGTHGVPNGYISCEGRCCQEAYEMYIEEWTE